ncbi:sugar ABC transporter substrate-binding protein [Paenibacillus rigui]|uniref:LacI family transcriptional regulator n=1 Tax=Paenibacillus rigui TaxID=554312 RepID=A0A229UWC8_9BACL|nr:substrate-binding domain-containing protein [Paenibacillus rigui]OXM87219.1 LacI family transcriptional regulator [Paenibacillus rigui]
MIARRCLLALTILVLLAAGGCKSSDSSGFALSPPASPLPEKEAPPAYSFGIIYPMAHPFYEMITKLTEEAAKPHGIRLIVKAPEEANLEQQIQMMETMIKQRVDGIAIDPIDPDALTPSINKAIQAGIPVVCFESDAPASHRLAYIGPNHFQGGALMGKVVDRLLKGQGMVLVESGLKSSGTHKERLDGMLQYLKRETRIQVLEVRYNEGSSERALFNMEQMIDNHPHFDALITLDIISSSTSILVWKAKGLNRNLISFGMMPEVKEALYNGQMTSTISQNEQAWGKQIIAQLLRASHGETIPAAIYTDVVEVTK